MSEKLESESSMLKESAATMAVTQESIIKSDNSEELVSKENHVQNELNTKKELCNSNESYSVINHDNITKDEKLHDKCHVFTTKIDNDLKCSLCLKAFKNKRKLKTHLYLCHCVIENIVSLQDNLFPTQEPVHSTSESDSELYDLIANGNINNPVCVTELSGEQSNSTNVIKNNNFNWKNKKINNFFADALRELEVANTLIDLQVLNSHKQVIENGVDENKNKNLLHFINLSDTNCLNKTNFHNGDILQKVIANKNTLANNSEGNTLQKKNEIKNSIDIIETKSENEINNFQNSNFNKCNNTDTNIINEVEINQSNADNEEDKESDTFLDNNEECERLPKNSLISNCLNPSLNSFPLFPYINFPLINSLSNGNFSLQELSHFKNNIRIDDETVLVTKLEGIHPTTKQSYVLYKCCLCGNAFSALDTLHNHVGNHGNNKEKNCGKCGAIFKCDGQLDLHNQLHQAIETNSLLSLTPGLFLTPFGAFCSQMENQNQDTPSGSGFNKLDPYWSMVQQIYAGYSGNIYPFLSVGNLPFFGNSQHSLINEIINNNTSTKSPVENLNKVPINKPVYKCSFCPKIFDRVFSLQRHERVHTGIKPCSCKICGRGFSEKRNLRHHVIRFHSDSNRKELLWRAHRQKSRLKSAHGPKKLVSFLKRAATCILNSMGQNKLDCNDDSSPDSSSELKNSESLQSSFNTMFDDQKNKPEISIKLNKEKHHDILSEENRQLKFKTCAQNNLTSNLFNKSNYQEITQERNLEKFLVEKTIKEESSVSDIKLKNEQDSENKEECLPIFNPRSDSINASTASKNQMTLASSQGNYSYICNYCSKTFCSTSDLKRHMDFHKNIRPYKCPSCEYRSRTNSQLKVHMMRHQGIRQYLCHPCNYGGVTQSDLNRHLKTRTHILRTRTICSS